MGDQKRATLSETLYQKHECKDWQQLVEFFRAELSSPAWMFRGQENAEWSFQTALERSLDICGIPLSFADSRERALLRRFQREAQHYLQHPPELNNFPEWLALLRHHGGPTRLLDWSHSFYVAVYFACIGQRDKDSAVWAIDWESANASRSDSVKQSFEDDINLRHPAKFVAVVSSGPGVVKLNAFRYNQRLAVQQGTFLIPTEVKRSFDDNITATLATTGRSALWKVTLPMTARPTILRELYRMNMHAASLFPGIDGLASSLETQLLVPKVLESDYPWSAF